MDGRRVGVEVEQSPGGGHEAHQPGAVGARDAQRQAALARLDLDHGRAVAQAQEPAVARAVERFEAGRGAGRQEGQHDRRVVRRAGGQAQLEACRGGRVGGPAQVARRRAERGLEHVVELAHRAEAGGEGHLGQRQTGLVDQPPCEVGPARARHRQRRGSDVLQEQPPQVAVAQPQPRGQRVDTLLVEQALVDQPQRALDARGRAGPGRRAWRGLRPAAPAGPVAGLLGRGGVAVERDVLAPRSRGRADRAAVDAGGAHGHEEAPVEARVARSQGPVATLVVQPHAPILGRGAGWDWRKTDLAATAPGRP